MDTRTIGLDRLPEPLLLGSHNTKKRQELERLLEPLGIHVRTLADYAAVEEVVEDGTTFAENARKKASGYAKQLGEWVLGEDSGLVVESLNGAPGIYSARFAGPDATDEQNNQLLLQRMTDLEPAQRRAHYVCHIALSSPQGEISIEADGICRGVIRPAPVGNHGFGYDPLFEIVEYHRTFGELGAAAKSAISHRARAMRSFARQLGLFSGRSNRR